MRIDWPLTLIISIVVVLIVLSVLAAIHEETQWEAFSAAHHCKVVAMMQGSTSTGVAAGKEATVVTVSTPGKTGFLCDDGITYWRND